MKIIDFGDQFTRNVFQTSSQKTFAMIKPDCFTQTGKIIDKIEKSGLVILNLCMHQFSDSEAQEFYGEHKGKPFYENLVAFISSGLVIGLELMGKDAVARWRTLLGPTNCFMARNESPNSIRAIFGTEGVRNAAHGSDSIQSAEREINLFFKKFDRNKKCFNFEQAGDFSKENKLQSQNTVYQNVSAQGELGKPQSLGGVSSVQGSGVSCIVIKPHILKEGNAGKVLDAVFNRCSKSGLRINAVELFKLNKDEVEEFMEVYKGVLPEYGLLVEEMKNGSLIAVMVQGGEGVVQNVRRICGPHDPQIAKTLRGDSLRAEFGKDRVMNGLHCTDLEDDGILECEFFFAIMQKGGL